MRLKLPFLLILALFLGALTFAQNFKSPAEFLGYEMGEKFTRHHRVMDYFEHLGETNADRVQLMEYGTTYEDRPLMLAFISSAENMAKLDEIRQSHIANSNGQGNPEIAIVWMSYNVHGNESVSTEASMQTVYELLTTKKEYLENTVVIVDPCVNPDGRERYVNWYGQYKNSTHQVDPNSKEHHEPWLNGRANHYMFDLNRDWAWLTQKESQQRLKIYNKWLPHVHVDFHEQQVDSPYYFAPAAEPFHEVITNFQRDFQVTVGKNHAKYFDANGWFYFTKEVFDLLYPSYGDTYPTYNGSIGMTYEQGGSGRAGLGIVTSLGDTLTLKDRIEHHRTTGHSTLEIASKHAKKLNEEFKKFHQSKDYKYKSYVLNGKKDKLKALTDLLDLHEITYGKANSGSIRGFHYTTGKTGTLRATEKSIVVPVDQKKGTLVKVLFEPKAKLTDSLTYDITAWSLPYAYGLDAVATENSIKYEAIVDGEKVNTNTDLSDAYAYIAHWNSFSDAQFLSHLLKNKIKVRFAMKPFTLDGQKYHRGSLIITKSDNQNNQSFLTTLSTAAKTYDKEITPTNTGFVEAGKDFGSYYVQMVPNSKIAVLSGNPTSTLRFGEVWHFFEQQLEYPVTILDESYFDHVELSEYDILVLPDGERYGNFLTDSISEKITEWVSNGGKLIAMGGALKSFAKNKSFSLKAKKMVEDSTLITPNFDYSQREQIKEEITGAIFKTHVDTTHPLAYGYDDIYFSMKLGSDSYDYLEKGTVVYLDENNVDPVSGFAGSEAKKRIGNSMIFGSLNHGKGQVVFMVDNPLFRGFWENGKLFFANALFMVN
ncbi:M14 family metallopeptidase [Euzebyella saccharophila]|uniref:M14 family zinc carboxypeptidase n=1 Tax=Euzebyella saccharophila TaxID=679664 RepID=A0ABV8JNI2_9FLAO|nr:M14 family metallopeptidase [Euzebyella saccharophila]